MSSNLHITSSLGLLHLQWSTFETILEILCHRILGVTHKQNCILFCSLSFKAKQEITISLLKDSKLAQKEKIISLIRKISKIASRNHLFHSEIYMDKNNTEITFIKREIQKCLAIKQKSFNEESLQKHIKDVMDECLNLEDLCGISDADIVAHGNQIKTYHK